jgi:hypothetical protein
MIALHPVNDDIFYFKQRFRTTTPVTHINNSIPEYQDVMTKMKYM